MQAYIAQAAALTCAGNAFIRKRDIGKFWPNADVFKFTKLCEFRDLSGGNRLVAPDPQAWLGTLKGKCEGLRLFHAPRQRQSNQTIPIPERQTVSFVGGGPVFGIEVLGRTRSVVWQGFDRVGDRADPQQKVWLTTYLRGPDIEPINAAKISMEQMSTELNDTLGGAESLAAKMGLSEWAAVFNDARNTLTAKDPAPPYYDFSQFAGLGVQQRRVWAACVKGFVFHNMGSWNDVVPAEPYREAYELISERLFHVVCNGVCAVANSTYWSDAGF